MNEREIFAETLQRPKTERSAYLDEVCKNDPAMRRRIETLLHQQADLGSFMEHPPLPGALRDVSSEHGNSADVQNAADAINLIPLDFLEPTEEEDSLGRLGSYEITEVIGRGGMGIVLKGRDNKLNRVAAVKVLAPELAGNATARKRFRRESQAAAAVSHDHVVTIFAVEDAEPPYLVMEYIDGPSLQQKIDAQGTMEVKEILRIGRQVALGLAAAHEQGLIHRDVKPSNILLQNGIERAQITDFGLARAVDDVDITRTGQIAGTPHYMSPEQAQGLTVDARSDLFSLGCVLYAMSTGRSPFRAETTIASIRRVCDETPRPIREVNPDIPDWLTGIIARLLAKSPEDRFQTADEVAELLGSHLAQLQDPNSTPFPGTLRARSQPIRRRYWFVASAALLMVVLALGFTEATGVTRVGNYVATVLRIRTPEGTLVLEIDDPGVQVAIEGNGEKLTITGAGIEKLQLKPGRYQVRASKDGKPVPLNQELVTLTINGKQVVRVSRESVGSDQDADSAGTAIKDVRQLSGQSSPVHSVAVSPDGDIVASGGDTSIVLVSRTTGRPIHTLNTEFIIDDLEFTPDGNHLLSAGRDGAVRLWNVETGKKVREFAQHEGGAKCVDISGDGQWVLTGGNDGMIRLSSLETGKLIREIDAKSDVWSVRFSSNGERFISSGNDGPVRVWKLTTDQGELTAASEHKVLSGHEEGVYTVSFSPDDRFIVSGGTDNTARIWDAETGRQLQLFRHPRDVMSAAFTADGRFIMTGCRDKGIRIWNVTSGNLISQLHAKTYCTLHLELTPDGRHAVSGGGLNFERPENVWRSDGDHDLHVWRLPEKVWPEAESSQLTVVRPFEGHTGPVKQIAVSPDGKRVLSGSGYPQGDWSVRLWEVATGKELRTLNTSGTQIMTVCFSPDGNRAAASGVGGVIHVWEVETGRESKTIPTKLEVVDDLEFSPDGRQLLLAAHKRTFNRRQKMSGGAKAQLWDAENSELIWEYESAGWLTTAAFLTDGERVIVAGKHTGDHIQFLDRKTSNELRELQFGDSTDHQIEELAVSRDGRFIASASELGYICLWDVNGGEKPIKYRGNMGNLRSVAFSPDGKRLFCGGGEGEFGNLRWLKVPSLEIIASVEHPAGLVWHVAYLPDGRHALSAGGYAEDRSKGDYALRLWRLPEAGSPAVAKWNAEQAQRDFESAEELLRDGESSLTVSPSQAEPKLRKALEIYERLLTAFPENSQYRHRRNWSRLRLGQSLMFQAHFLTFENRTLTPKNAERALAAALAGAEFNPGEKGSLTTVAFVYYRRGEWEKSLEFCQKSEQARLPEDGADYLACRNHFLLAMVYWQLDRKEKAAEVYQMAVTWMQANKPKDVSLNRQKQEAEELLATRIETNGNK